MRKHLQYLKYVVRHKWFVFLACLEYGLIWRGIKHDWTKFLPSEWFAYVEYFYGQKVAHPKHKTFQGGDLVPLMESPEHVKKAFDAAWNHHQKANSHHWQYWLLSPDNPRPNFTRQSMDCISHAWVARADNGEKAALIFDWYNKDWAEPSPEVQMALDRDLWNTPVPLDIPMVDRKEMIADWIGAGRALGKPDTYAWYQSNKRNIFLHPDTQAWVEAELNRLRIRRERDEWWRKVQP